MSNVDLDFHKAYTPPSGGAVDLNFSLNPDGVLTAGVLAMVQPSPTLQITGNAQPATPVEGSCTLTISSVQTVHLTANYDNNVFRGPSVIPGSAWQAAVPNPADRSSTFQQAGTQRTAHQDTWQPAALQTAEKGSGFEQAATARTVSGGGWQAGGHVEQLLLSRFEYGIRLRTAPLDGWQATLAKPRALTDGFQNGIRKRGEARLPWQETTPAARDWRFTSQQAEKTRCAPVIPWQEAKQAYWAPGEVPPVEPPDETYDGTGKPLDFRCLWLDYAGDDILLNFAIDPCPPVNPPDGETIIVPVKRVYIVINATTLRRVDGNVLIPAFSMSLSIDADSWTWGFNASLPAETLDAIEPGSDGTPVELEAVINGTAYRVLAEKISRERTFGRAAIRVSGKGKSGLLDTPYAPVQNFSNSSAARTAQQLANDALTVNGASIGWTVNWQATDWLVPAGAWSHQGSYVSALNAIAGAAGAYIQPHPSLKTLNVLSRYPTAPWNWGSVTPDFELPASVTTREGIEWLERPRYNRVFVSGQGQGVLGQVTRTGTAGDILAPMMTDALITHADAARQRGLAILGDTGRQAHLSLRLPVLEETGVIQPGKFVRYVDGGVTRIGIVRSTSVDVSNPEVWQTIGVETHVATA
ncbi:hypothetical protein [Cupriavidus oxalaticus]|uniref:Uncharacterized protein n=1 Tax=Cupriavidus oxalaticus TaxID=96344 RepID=A0A375GBL1_9BURK|nr:hypothetical protein [Cupriavidus oxalaticus]QRQ86242.1 hypothetical protein JTE91_23835 [Cupriavidus oxalaticus]QRQ95431.1 hypothetical protein JTE92_18425 [Cupriavidus oxalaticus]WQD84088.1 hypothetical protein U0036_06135 [Cupriavidus oxalaticus]SPC17402.1 conserved hypothetical protein [Cupriavidus oxalaticus]